MRLEDPDHALRVAALERARELARIFDDVVPLAVIREGFQFGGDRVSFGSFQKGIHRARHQRGPAALTLATAPPKLGKAPPYEDLFDEETGSVIYHYRTGSPDQADNRSLRAARELAAPLIYFKGIFGLVRRRYQQVKFRRDVLHAYGNRCTICSLREVDLLEASHIVRDTDEQGIAAVVNGLALCAIHHRAYDRNLVGIDPRGTVHISERLLREIDGPMLGNGLQHFHGTAINQPRREANRPSPQRLEARFEEFEIAAA